MPFGCEWLLLFRSSKSRTLFRTIVGYSSHIFTQSRGKAHECGDLAKCSKRSFSYDIRLMDCCFFGTRPSVFGSSMSVSLCEKWLLRDRVKPFGCGFADVNWFDDTSEQEKWQFCLSFHNFIPTQFKEILTVVFYDENIVIIVNTRLIGEIAARFGQNIQSDTAVSELRCRQLVRCWNRRHCVCRRCCATHWCCWCWMQQSIFSITSFNARKKFTVCKIFV